MDLTIKAEQISVVSASGSYAKVIEVEITGVDDSIIKQISKEASLDELLAEKTEAEIRTWVVNEFSWVQNLLHDFWQLSSDACPLEANESEEQENAFKEFVDNL